MEWQAQVGANIRRLRKGRGITQEALAHDADVAVRYLAGVERGQENISLNYLVRIAEALGVDPSELLAR